MMSNFQIQLFSHTSGFIGSNPCAAQVAVLVEKLPFPESPQDIESGIELVRIGVARINCKWIESTRELSLATSHSLLSVINYDTLREVTMSRRSITLSKLAKLSFAHQLSSQN